MGLDVSVLLVAGVPLAALGHIVEDTETVVLTDRLGKPTKERATLSRVYVHTPNGRRLLIGSNEQNILNGYGTRIDYALAGLFPDIDEDEDCDWVHVSNYAAPLDNAIIGVSIPSAEGPPVGARSHESYKMAPLDHIPAAVSAARMLLANHFGYDGEIAIVAIAGYGY